MERLFFKKGRFMNRLSSNDRARIIAVLLIFVLVAVFFVCFVKPSGNGVYDDAEAKPKPTYYSLSADGEFVKTFKVSDVTVASEYYDKVPVKVVYTCTDGTVIEMSGGMCVIHYRDNNADTYLNASMVKNVSVP